MTTWHHDLLHCETTVAKAAAHAHLTGDVVRIRWVDGAYTYCTPAMVRFEETR